MKWCPSCGEHQIGDQEMQCSICQPPSKRQKPTPKSTGKGKEVVRDGEPSDSGHQDKLSCDRGGDTPLPSSSSGAPTTKDVRLGLGPGGPAPDIDGVGRRGLNNTIQRPGLRLGIVVWNVAHFGAGSLDIAAALTSVVTTTTKFIGDQVDPSESLFSKLGPLLEAYATWRREFVKLLPIGRELGLDLRGSKLELEELEAWHCGNDRSAAGPAKPDGAQAARAGVHGKTGRVIPADAEASAEATNDDEPEGLVAHLRSCWAAFDSHKSLDRCDWERYCTLAVKEHGVAWQDFVTTWCLGEAVPGWENGGCPDGIEGTLLRRFVSFVPALRKLRGRAMMVVKPLYQLRERVNLAKKITDTLNKHVEKVRTSVQDIDTEIQARKDERDKTKDKIETRSRHLGAKGLEEVLCDAGKVDESLRRVTERREELDRIVCAFEVAVEKLGMSYEEAKAASSWQLGPVFKNVVKLDGVVHRILVAHRIALMFEQNSWLDVVGLHEVNDGMGSLKCFLEQRGLTCETGFRIKSRGRSGQPEYYPIVYRAGGRINKVKEIEAVFNDGARELYSFDASEKRELRWDKTQNRYRSIICYKLEIKTGNGDVLKDVRIGVVHTTPAGNEADRVSVYDQIDGPLKYLARSAIPLVVGGDFYLTAEAVTRAFHELTPEGRKLASRTLAQYRKSLETKRDELAQTVLMLQEDRRGTPHDPSELRDEAQKIHDQQVHLEWLISRYREGAIQTIRNDANLQISVEKRIQALGLEVAQPLVGTNWKTKQVDRWFDAQIADFFVHTGPHSTPPNSRWQKTRVGIVDLTEGLRLSDESSLDVAQHWALISDHCPVGITLSMAAADRWVDQPFHHLDRMILWARLHELAAEMKRQGASAAGGEQTGTLVPPGEIPPEGDAALAGVIVRRPSSGEYVAYLRHGDRWRELASDSSILRDPGDVHIEPRYIVVAYYEAKRSPPST